MNQQSQDYSTILPCHFFSNPQEKTRLNWFAFELACEIERAVPLNLKKHLARRGYTKVMFNRSCIYFAKLLQGVVLKKLRNEIPSMEFDYAQIEKAFPNLNDKIVNKLLNCTTQAWERLLSICVSCPMACVTNKDQCSPMFDDSSYYGN